MLFAYIILILLFLILATFAYASLRGAPWVPAHSSDLQRCLALANIAPGEHVVDLGCGDGRFVAAAARVGARATGYEISLLPYCLALIRSWNTPSSRRPRIVYADFWRVDLSTVDVVFMFLMPATLTKLAPKLRQELRPGSRVITYVWPIPGWSPDRVDSSQANAPKLFHYTM